MKKKAAPKKKPPPPAAWCVYLLRCGDGSLYAGMTNDLPRRVEKHAQGTASRYTRSRLPVLLVYSEPQPDRGAALRREHAIKRLAKAAKEALTAVAAPAPKRRTRRPRVAAASA